VVGLARVAQVGRPDSKPSRGGEEDARRAVRARLETPDVQRRPDADHVDGEREANAGLLGWCERAREPAGTEVPRGARHHALLRAERRDEHAVFPRESLCDREEHANARGVVVRGARPVDAVDVRDDDHADRPGCLADDVPGASAVGEWEPLAPHRVAERVEAPAHDPSRLALVRTARRARSDGGDPRRPLLRRHSRDGGRRRRSSAKGGERADERDPQGETAHPTGS
jgi:hypothetical protein